LKTVCLTSGTNLADLLWTTTVLPYFKRSQPQTRLIWECPARELKPWLRLFSELDRVVGDVEELESPPDCYLILNPFWHPVDEKANTPLEAVFSLASPWCPIPAPLPGRPYAPHQKFAELKLEGFPRRYLCFDPQVCDSPERNEAFQKTWVTVIAYLSIPAVQVGPANSVLIPGMVDGRGWDILKTSQIINQSLLFIGGDSGFSALAGALRKPQVWLCLKDSNWWWPRGVKPECLLYMLDDLEKFNLETFLSLAWQALETAGAQNEI
jgi:ADP-heptose:LPS heptosyltransferase